jgi:Na+-transporting methylmalonyl-CoA/oxaloacetate decarboxylase gamma subunit
MGRHENDEHAPPGKSAERKKSSRQKRPGRDEGELRQLLPVTIPQHHQHNSRKEPDDASKT